MESFKRKITFFFAVGLLLSQACTENSDFSNTENDCYKGAIVNADFLLGCFDPSTEMYLKLDVDQLERGCPDAAFITTTDNRFDRAPVQQPEHIAVDSLSTFNFPSGRNKNYLAFVHQDDAIPSTAVISLMENGKVEVRLIRLSTPALTCSEDTNTAEDCSSPNANLFGLFQLKRTTDCDD